MTAEEEAKYKAGEKMRIFECLRLVSTLTKEHGQADTLTILAMAAGLSLRLMCKTEREFARGTDKVMKVVSSCRTLPLPPKK